VGDFSLTQFHTAEEVFVTGTMGGLTPVLEIDGRTIGAGSPGPVTRRLSALFGDLTARSGTLVV
jgi:branched-chain amino acid aminotransferase